jgi:UPF0716 protein FxsA
LRVALVLIVLAFPVLEIWSLVILARFAGWWLLLWIAISAVIGVVIILRERARIGPNMRAMLQGGASSLPELLYAFRRLVAGILLVIPGVVGDVIAVVLLLLPAPTPKPEPGQSAAQIIDGKFRRVDSAKPDGDSR